MIVALYGLAGGCGDAASFLLYKTFTGHVTGNLVLMMVSLAHEEWSEVAQRLLATCAFLLATRVGFVVARSPRSTAWLVLAQTVLLLPVALRYPGLSHVSMLGVLLCCLSLGLQNGIITTSRGVSLHSTFLSGDFTKLLKPASVDAQKAMLPGDTRMSLACLIGGFTGGALVAAELVHRRPAFTFPVLLAAFWIAFLAQAALGKPKSQSPAKGSASVVPTPWVAVRDTHATKVQR